MKQDTKPKIALSVRQPWARLIIRPDLKSESERAEAAGESLIKLIENRDWNCNHTGPLLIHASKTMTQEDYEGCLEFIRGRHIIIPLPPFTSDQFKFGGIIGQVTMTGATRQTTSKWFVGPFGFMFKDSTPLPFKPYRGMPGLFKVARQVSKEGRFPRPCPIKNWAKRFRNTAARNTLPFPETPPSCQHRFQKHRPSRQVPSKSVSGNAGSGQPRRTWPTGTNPLRFTGTPQTRDKQRRFMVCSCCSCISSARCPIS